MEIKKWLLLTVERFCISQLEINQSECHKRSKLSVSGEVYYSFLTAKERAMKFESLGYNYFSFPGSM